MTLAPGLVSPTAETGQATSGRHNAGASVAAAGIQTQRDKRETRPQSQRLQNLASDRRDWETHWETQGDKWKTRLRSRRHSIWHLTAETGRNRETSGRRPRSRRHGVWPLTRDTTPEPASQRRRDCETQGDKRGRHDPGASVTASGRQAGDTTLESA